MRVIKSLPAEKAKLRLEPFILLLTILWLVSATPIESSPATIVSGPTVIDGDSEIASSSVVSSGDGTPDDPFLIENVHFLVYRYGLWIKNVSAHIVIRENHFAGVSDTSGAAIIIESTSNATVVKNQIQADRGVLASGSYNIRIAENEIESPPLVPGRAIVLRGGSEIHIMGNEISAPAAGVDVEGTRDIVVARNNISITNGFSAGIAFWIDVVNGTISENRLDGSGGGTAVYLTLTSNITLFANHAADWGSGFTFSPTMDGTGKNSGVIVLANVIQKTGAAISPHLCTDCEIVGNYIFENRAGILLGEVAKISCNTFSGNKYAIYGNNDQGPRNNTFIANEVAVRSLSGPMDMRWNWWSHPSGPDPEQFEGEVLYDPWLEVAPECEDLDLASRATTAFPSG